MVLVFLYGLGMAGPVTADSNFSLIDTAKDVIPNLKSQEAIYFDGRLTFSVVEKLAYSPDGHYLAIMYSQSLGQTNIVIWDVLADRKQSQIHCSFDYGLTFHNDVLWDHTGKVISFGIKRQWDAVTGSALPDNPVVGRSARLNETGSKLVTIMGAVGEPSYLYIYDTSDWSVQKIYADGLAVESVAWTRGDKIMVGVMGTRNTINKIIDGRVLAPFDAGIRLLDPTGRDSTRAIWYPAIHDNIPGHAPWRQAVDIELLATNFHFNQVALGGGQIISGDTMAVLTYFSSADIASNKVEPGSGGLAFSLDGKYMFVKAIAWFDNRSPVINSVIDTRSGKKVSEFGGGDRGLAISPDGRHVAIGNVHSVRILDF